MNFEAHSNVRPYPRDPRARGVPHPVARVQHTTALAPNPSGTALARHAGGFGPADEFREIRTRLLALGGADNFVTLVVPVTSGSGGSYVARNLAAAFAFDEAKTAVLVDCNLRHPTQHGALNITTAHGGLLDYLEQPQRGLAHVLYQTGVPRLQLIPAGDARQWSMEYFSSARLSTLIDSLRARSANRYLFLDGPPLTASPDASILSALADFIVIVAGYGRDTPQAINRAITGLDSKKIAGVVFNDPN
jgi:Mrp family chromosome partitioning ATPase